MSLCSFFFWGGGGNHPYWMFLCVLHVFLQGFMHIRDNVGIIHCMSTLTLACMPISTSLSRWSSSGCVISNMCKTYGRRRNCWIVLSLDISIFLQMLLCCNQSNQLQSCAAVLSDMYLVNSLQLEKNMSQQKTTARNPCPIAIHADLWSLRNVGTTGPTLQRSERKNTTRKLYTKNNQDILKWLYCDQLKCIEL